MSEKSQDFGLTSNASSGWGRGKNLTNHPKSCPPPSPQVSIFRCWWHSLFERWLFFFKVSFCLIMPRNMELLWSGSTLLSPFKASLSMFLKIMFSRLESDIWNQIPLRVGHGIYFYSFQGSCNDQPSIGSVSVSYKILSTPKILWFSSLQEEEGWGGVRVVLAQGFCQLFPQIFPDVVSPHHMEERVTYLSLF